MESVWQASIMVSARVFPTKKNNDSITINGIVHAFMLSHRFTAWAKKENRKRVDRCYCIDTASAWRLLAQRKTVRMNISTPAPTTRPTTVAESNGMPVTWLTADRRVGIRYTAIVTPMIPSTNPFVYSLTSNFAYSAIISLNNNS